MSSFTVSCPYCGQCLEADDSFVGRTAECPICGKLLSVEAPAAVNSAGTTPEFHAGGDRNRKVPGKDGSLATGHSASHVVSRNGRRWTGSSAAQPSSSARLFRESPLKKKSRVGLWVFFGVLVVAGIVGGIMLTKSGKDDIASSAKRKHVQTEGMNGSQVRYEVHFSESGEYGPVLLVKCETDSDEFSLDKPFFVFDTDDIGRFYRALPRIRAEYVRFVDETAEEKVADDNESSYVCYKKMESLSRLSGFDSTCVAWYSVRNKKLSECNWMGSSANLATGGESRDRLTNRTFPSHLESDGALPFISFVLIKPHLQVKNDWGKTMPSNHGCMLGMGAKWGMGGRAFKNKVLLAFKNLPPRYENGGIRWFLLRFLVPEDFDELQRLIGEAVPARYL